MDVMLHDFLLHVLEIHTPYIILILYELTVNDVIAVVCQTVGEADVGRFVNQDVIAPGAVDIKR